MGEELVREGETLTLRTGAASCCTRPRELHRRRAAVVVPAPPAPRVASSATLETTEAFGLDAAYVMTRHFRYTFADVWSAAQRAVLLARVVHVGRARRYKHRKTPASLSLSKPLSSCASHGEDKLRRYAAILASPKPNQDDEF
jgi:hypothetical protein